MWFAIFSLLCGDLIALDLRWPYRCVADNTENISFIRSETYSIRCSTIELFISAFSNQVEWGTFINRPRYRIARSIYSALQEHTNLKMYIDAAILSFHASSKWTWKDNAEFGCLWCSFDSLPRALCNKLTNHIIPKGKTWKHSALMRQWALFYHPAFLYRSFWICIAFKSFFYERSFIGLSILVLLFRSDNDLLKYLRKWSSISNFKKIYAYWTLYQLGFSYFYSFSILFLNISIKVKLYLMTTPILLSSNSSIYIFIVWLIILDLSCKLHIISSLRLFLYKWSGHDFFYSIN